MVDTRTDPYIYGSDETVLIDVRELRESDFAERWSADGTGSTDSRDSTKADKRDDTRKYGLFTDPADTADSYRGSHRRASIAEPGGFDAGLDTVARTDKAMLLYADGGTAIPLDRVREVCHDLRQPVAAILMLASAAEIRPDVPEGVRRMLQEITTQAEDISAAVRQFLDDAKQGVDGLGDPRPVNIAGLAGESIERWRATFQGGISYAAEDDPLHVTIDPVLFRRALGNLLSNATRAAGVGGRVTVTVRRMATKQGQRAVIEVDDNGPGFGKITSGHGLGLAVVQRTVRAAGGSVEIAEGTLGGALVRLVLPVTAPARERLDGSPIVATPTGREHGPAAPNETPLAHLGAQRSAEPIMPPAATATLAASAVPLATSTASTPDDSSRTAEGRRLLMAMAIHQGIQQVCEQSGRPALAGPEQLRALAAVAVAGAALSSNRSPMGTQLSLLPGGAF